MPLFKKKKKQKIRDRFMAEVLGAKFPIAKSSEIMDYDFADKFSEKKLKIIGSNTDRTVLGRGEFDKPYQQSKVIVRKYAKYISGTDDPDDNTVAEMITEFERLEAMAEAWMQSDEAKWVDKDSGKKDRITQIKEIETRGMLHGAKLALFQLRNRDKLAEQATQDLFDKLEAAQSKLEDPTTDTPEARDEFRAVDAEVLSKVCGMKKPSGGTSEVYLIKGPDGSVAYAFKPMKGESTMMGTPEGAGAVREVLMSKMCETIKSQNGPDFGWPKTTMAAMDVGKAQPLKGALVEGMKGTVFPSEQPIDAKAGEYNELKAKGNQILPKLAAADVQKIALCNLAMGNYDNKWDNAMIETTTDGVKARPFDAGVAMPDLDTFMRLCHVGTVGGGGSLGSGGLKNPGGNFTLDLDGKPLKSASAKMDPELVQQFQNIDINALQAAVQGEIQRLDQKYQTNCAQLGLDQNNAFAVTAECLKATKKLLQDGNMTLDQFVQDYQTEMIDKLVNAKQAQWTPQWTQDMTAQYTQLKNRYPALVYQNETDPKQMFLNWVSPGQNAYLQTILQLVDPNDPNLLTTYPGLKWPSTTFKSALVTLKSVRRDAHVAALKPVANQIKSARDQTTAENIAKQALRQANIAFDDSEVAERVKNARDKAAKDGQ